MKMGRTQMLIESAKKVKPQSRGGGAYEDMVKDVTVWWVACFILKGLESSNTNQNVSCNHSKLSYLALISISLPIYYSQIPF
jgi:hypothetical protein